MPTRAIGRQHVRALLDRMGVALPDDDEYAEVALRLGIVIQSIDPLMAALPAPDDAQVPADLPAPRARRR